MLLWSNILAVVIDYIVFQSQYVIEFREKNEFHIVQHFAFKFKIELKFQF